jgi:hypothetical protein
MAAPSFSLRMSPRLIRVLRRLSDSTLFNNRLSSEGRIPGFARISERVISRGLERFGLDDLNGLALPDARGLRVMCSSSALVAASYSIERPAEIRRKQ